MSFGDWVKNTSNRFVEYPLSVSVRVSVEELGVGLLRRLGKAYNNGQPVWERDWDVLVILDACRLDLAQDVAPEFGYDVDSHVSVASMSLEFFQKTFTEEYAAQQQETALITANPFSQDASVDLSRLAYVDEVWRDVWDDEVGITRAEEVVDIAIDYWRNRDTGVSKLIIWLMQPHVPFIGSPISKGYEHDKIEQFGVAAGRDSLSPWAQSQHGLLEKEELWAAYSENLRYAFESITPLFESVSGTVCVTSDHGNGLGEWGVWGHPGYVPIPALKRVPWIEIDATDTGGYSPTPPPRGDVGTQTVESKLSDLGYL